jgi:hypothetical protein
VGRRGPVGRQRRLGAADRMSIFGFCREQLRTDGPTDRRTAHPSPLWLLEGRVVTTRGFGRPL